MYHHGDIMHYPVPFSFHFQACAGGFAVTRLSSEKEWWHFEPIQPSVPSRGVVLRTPRPGPLFPCSGKAFHSSSTQLSECIHFQPRS
ncbi:hypothetical protein LDENG_00061060 [Lucifuga dentata]|nr:hypothetical protein LDENG_00061060 [Lucifuga dentata]